MRTVRIAAAVLAVVVIAAGAEGGADLPGRQTLRRWVVEMKTAARGPFARIRWFCSDGSILAPKPYACRKHGGGVQHGQWTERVTRLRDGGYYIANVLASLDPGPITSAAGYSDLYNQILIEKFLIAADDGWIFRRARYYRGAIQAENETAMARRLLLAMAGSDPWSKRGYLPLRMGAGLLKHGFETVSVAAVRQHSLALSEKDQNFLQLRAKIHNQPDAEDSQRVREYAAGIRDAELAAEYERLADEIDRVFASHAISVQLKQFQHQIAKANPRLARQMKVAIRTLDTIEDPVTRFAGICETMANLRSQFLQLPDAKLRLAALDTSLALEIEQYRASRDLASRLATATRRERLQWLADSAFAIYGAGLISALQLQDLQETFNSLNTRTTTLKSYRQALDYLARVPGWGTQWLRFHFHASMRKLAEIEPLAGRFIQDSLRGSPLFFYSNVLDSLLRDANQLAGLQHELFGRQVGGGLRSLNPGLARGKLRLRNTDARGDFDPAGIYLLPETVAALPPVAGILTAGEGNPLSHVQLLARNLGIPNVAVDEKLIPLLSAHEGKKVILAASPGGSVQLMLDKGQLDSVFSRTKQAPSLIAPDLNKLDLQTREIIPLSRLRAADSGRIVGPKAANLGELYQLYPEAVADGLAIPFGVFRSLLDQSAADGQQTVFEWMEAEYAAILALPDGSAARAAKMEALRQKLEKFILNADPGAQFRSRLQAAMEKVFGADGTYGVFVRSDTNVEDLPGFTGAGLNKTIPNVVGFDNVLAAIPIVWASPFSRRAFAWRQSHMDQPQHVYASVLLLRSVPSEKSGVMVTRDIDTGDADWISVAVNEGVGGAVDGQAAESLRINLHTGRVRRLAQATAPWRRVLNPIGGVSRRLVQNTGPVLLPGEMKQLIELARGLPQRYPAIVDAAGNPAPADVEFGFVKGRLHLFQIRPFLESARARSNSYLNSLDRQMDVGLDRVVNLDKPSGGDNP